MCDTRSHTLDGNAMPNANWPARFEGYEYPQVIPDPDDVQAGGPAPWAALEPEDRQGFTLSHVMQRLQTGERLLDGWPIPGDPQEMDAVADATSRPLIFRSQCCWPSSKKTARPTSC
jgi:hypothetical protein